MQLQTQAGHQATPTPLNLPESKNNSDDSVSTLSSLSSNSSRKHSLDVVRCSRCQRSLSIEPAGAACQKTAIRFGTNSYYCRYSYHPESVRLRFRWVRDDPNHNLSRLQGDTGFSKFGFPAIDPWLTILKVSAVPIMLDSSNEPTANILQRLGQSLTRTY